MITNRSPEERVKIRLAIADHLETHVPRSCKIIAEEIFATSGLSMSTFTVRKVLMEGYKPSKPRSPKNEWILA